MAEILLTASKEYDIAVKYLSGIIFLVETAALKLYFSPMELKRMNK